VKSWRKSVGILLVAAAVWQLPLAAKTPQVPPKSGAEVAWGDEEADNNDLGSKQIIGMVEKVFIEPGGLTLDGRIDTGANSTSLGATGLEIVNEDGQDWALFTVKGVPMRSKIVKYVHIKQHGRPSQRRPVIMLNVTLGNVTQSVPTTLTDRSNFKYRILIGVNFLKDHFIVDVSRKYVLIPVVLP
jgi:hypothetical protein